MKQGTAPKKMDDMRDAIKAADCYLFVSPESNHSIPSALKGMVDTFGCSNYAYKASGVITYSINPTGGVRCAIAMRPWLSELGCLPVSRMVNFFTAAEGFSEDGVPKEDYRAVSQLPQMLEQLEWMSVAMKKMRDEVGVPK